MDEWDELGKEFDNMQTPSPKPRSLWQRFRDAYLEGALHSPIGAEGVVRATTDLSTEELNRRERILSDKLAKRRAQDDEAFKDVDALSPANIGKWTVDLAGNILGGADPTYALSPGKTIAQRVAAQGAINAGVDAGSQGVELERGVRDEYDPKQTVLAGVGGSVLQGGSEVSRAIARSKSTLSLDDAVGVGNKFGTVTSTVRSKAKNKQVGGVPNSYHVRGQAIDVARGKGVSHKAIERAYRRAGFDIIESLDEGDHSHFAFRFGKRKGEPVIEDFDFRPSEQRPDDLGDIRLVRDELPDVEEMARVNEALSPEAENIVRMSFDDPIADRAPTIDSTYDRYTPYVDRPSTPANDADDPDVSSELRRMDREIEEREQLITSGKFKDPVIDLITGEWRERSINPKGDDSYDFLNSEASLRGDDLVAKGILTPAERQEMDASATRPDIPPVRPAGLGKGSVATTPVNDLREYKINPKDLFVELEKPGHYGITYHHPSGAKITADLVKKGNGVYDVDIGGIGTDSNILGPGMVRKLLREIKKHVPDLKEINAERITGARMDNPQYTTIRAPEVDVPPPPNPPLPNDPDFPKPGTPGNRGGPKGGADDPVEQRLINDLKQLKPMTGEQRALYREERSRRGSSLSNLQRGDATRENIAQQFGSQRGQLPKKAYQSIAENYSEADFVSLANRINHSPRLLPFQKLNAHKALLNLLGTEGAKLPTPSEIKLLSEVYSEDFIKTLLENRTFLQKTWQNVKNALNVPRAIMSSMDFSAPFRQGIGLVHKKEFRKSIPHMFKMWADTMTGGNADKEWLNSIKSHPRWAAAVEANLGITDPHSHFLAEREEDFMTDWAEKIPAGAGRLIKASNSAYSGFLNKLRWDTFNNLLDQKEAMGDAVDGKTLKQIGKFVNMATGRGDLGKNGNAAAPALSALLFSPRLIASRVKTLASPVTYMTADPLVRKEAWKSLLAMSAYYLTLGGIAKYGLGMDVETDPRSADFMKAKIGNTRYDFMAGYSQYIRLGAQLLTDKTITGKGVEKDLTSSTGYKDDTRRDVAIRFFLNKLAPVPSLVSDWMEGSDMTGEPFEWKKAITSRMLPMASQDIADAIREWGPVGAAMGLPGLVGWSVQTYEPRAAKPKEAKDEWDKLFEESGSQDEWDKLLSEDVSQ